MFYHDAETPAYLKDAAEETADRGLGIFLDIRLKRLPRQRCVVCGHRRVCFILSAEDLSTKLQGRPVCAVDAGIRP